MVNALAAFKQDYPEAQTRLLHRGTERAVIKDTLCMPVTDFLKRLHPDNPLPG